MTILKRFPASLAALLVVAAMALGDGLPAFNTQPPANTVYLYDSASAEITTTTYPDAEVRAYVANAADTSAVGSYIDFTYTGDGWEPGTVVDTSCTVDFYTIDTAVDTLRRAGFVLVGKYGPKEWITTDQIKDASVTDAKIVSVDGSKLVAASVPTAALDNAAVTSTKLASGAALANLVSGSGGSASVDMGAGDGSGTDTIHVQVDSLTAWEVVQVDNLLTMSQPGAGTDGEIRIATADFHALVDVTLGSGAGDTLWVNGGYMIVTAQSVLSGDVTVSGDITANSDVITLGNTTSDQVTVSGDLTVEDDMIFGDGIGDTALFGGPVTLGLYCDSTSTHTMTAGFQKWTQAMQVLTYPISVTSADFAFPGAVSGMSYFAWVTGGAAITASTTNLLSAYYLSPGWIRVKAGGASISTREFTVIAFKQ